MGYRRWQMVDRMSLGNFNFHDCSFPSTGDSLGALEFDSPVSVVNAEAAGDGVAQPFESAGKVVIIERNSEEHNQANDHAAWAAFFSRMRSRTPAP